MAKRNSGREGEPLEYVEYTSENGCFRTLVQRSGDCWIVYACRLRNDKLEDVHTLDYFGLGHKDIACASAWAAIHAIEAFNL